MRKLACLSALMISASVALAQVPGAPGGDQGIPGFPPTQPPASTQPTTQPALLAEAQAGLQKIVDAVQSGNADQLQAAVQAKTEPQKKAAANFAKLNASAVGLFKAVEGKFGKEKLEKDNITLARFPIAFPPLDPKMYTDVKAEGATVTLVPGPESGYPELTLVKEDGQYKLDSSLIPTNDDESGAESPREKMFAGMLTQLTNTLEDVNAGKFREADEAVAVMELRLQRTMNALRQEMMEKAMKDEMKRRADAASATTQPSGPPMPATKPAADVVPGK